MLKSTSPVVIHLKTQSGAFIASALTTAFIDVNNLSPGSISNVVVTPQSSVV